MIKICLYSCAAGVLLCSTASAIVNPALLGGGIGLGRSSLGLSAIGGLGIGTLGAAQFGIGPSLGLGGSGLIISGARLRLGTEIGWEVRRAGIGDNAQLANIDLQNILQKQQTLQTMSNVSKMLHDISMAIIRKIGG